MPRRDLEDFVGNESMKIVDALRKIDNNALGILFVVDDEGKLIGALSDGDIRRWLIKTGNLGDKICMAMNKKPKFLEIGQEEFANRILVDHYITAVPIVNEHMHIVDVICSKYVSDKKRHNGLNSVPVVMMAGGKGTRLYPYTKILPKPLIPVGEKPIAEIIIESFCNYGCNDYYLIVNHKKNMIKAYFNEIEKDYHVYYVDEDTPLGTGGGGSTSSWIDKRYFYPY